MLMNILEAIKECGIILLITYYYYYINFHLNPHQTRKRKKIVKNPRVQICWLLIYFSSRMCHGIKE